MTISSWAIAVSGATLGSLILAAAFVALSLGAHAPPGLRRFAAAFALGGLRYLSLLVEPQVAHQVAMVVADSAHAAMAVLLVGGSFAFVGRAAPVRAMALAWGAATLWSLVATYGLGDDVLRQWVSSAFAAAGLGVTAWAFFRAPERRRGSGHLGVAVGFALWGLHKLDYPWLSATPLGATVGFLAAQGLATALAVGLFMLAEGQQRRVAIQALQHAAASQRHRETTEHQVRDLLAGFADAVVGCDDQGAIHIFNAAAERIFGCDAAQAAGLTVNRLLPDASDPEWPGGCVAPRDGGALAGERLGLRCDGRTVPVDFSVSSLDIDGRTLRVGVVRDISDRTLSHALDEMVEATNQRVLQGHGVDQFAGFVCQRLSDLLQLPLVWIGTREAEGLVTIRAAAGSGGEYLTGHVIRWDDTPEGHGPTGQAIRSGETQVAEVDDPVYFERLRLVRAAGFRTIASIPLVAHNRVVGALNVCTPTSFDDAALRRLETLGQRLGLAIQTAVDQQRLRLQGAAMASAANAIFITDAEGHIEWVNDAFARLSGYRLDEAVGRTPRLLHSGMQTSALYGDLWRTVLGGQVWRGEMVERRKDGSLYSVEQTITPMRDADGVVRHYVVVHEDITERKRAEERIRFLSNYDAMTGLPNRALFRERLGAAVGRAAANGGGLAVLFLDLEHFSRVNDSLGHDIGDRVLTMLVERLNAGARSADLIARIGGDEFAVVMSDLPNTDAAAALARKLTAEVARPFDLDGHEIHIGSSIGIAVYPDDGDSPDQLIKCADMAMYRAIHEAPNGYRFFATEMDDEIRLRIDLERDLRRALARREMELHYQPQLDAATGRIVGMESLIRWRHPERGLVSPGRFIPIAEDTGLIVPIGNWVVAEACRQQRAWLDRGVAVVPMAVNVSAGQLSQPDFPVVVEVLLRDSQLDPTMIELELTESAVMTDPEAGARLLSHFSERGFKIAIDDFGTGYSSLNYLKRFPVHRLKIDQSFVRDLTVDPNDAEICRAIITMGHSLGLNIVSEGVETAAQCAYLRAEGCDVLQGFLFSKAVPAAEMEALLRDNPFMASWPAMAVAVGKRAS